MFSTNTFQTTRVDSKASGYVAHHNVYLRNSSLFNYKRVSPNEDITIVQSLYIGRIIKAVACKTSKLFTSYMRRWSSLVS